jgi:hypothetical protein
LPSSIRHYLTVRLLFFLYPLIANVAFEALSCHRAFDDGTTFLIADVDIECRSDYYHSRVLPRAWASIAIFCFGLLAFNGVLLFSARRAIVHKKPTALSRAVSFLYNDYKPWAFWWELLEMGRRLVLVGIFVLIERGSILQLVVGTMFCAVYLCAHALGRPSSLIRVRWTLQ